ncbi:unnamed protein product, partial [marine sediment metagenome]
MRNRVGGAIGQHDHALARGAHGGDTFDRTRNPPAANVQHA